tara:strand:- start:467 stop:1288 length:822 start_codon:yes stop_codon:yes gene_type:complete
MDAGSIKLRKFNLDLIPPTAIVMAVGRRGTGKTTLSADILHAIGHNFDAGIAFSATEESNKFWGKHIPDTIIHGDFNEKLFHNFISEQRRINSKLTKPLSSFCLLEDCMYSRVLRTNKDIRALFFNGRHYGIFTLLTMQYAYDLTPDLRSQVDFVFILRNNNIQDKERLWKGFCGMVPTFSLFQKILNSCTVNYDCLVVNNMSRSSDITDCIFWYSANRHDDFKIGKRPLWEYHYKMRKIREDDEEEQEDGYYGELCGKYNTYTRTTNIQKLL